MSVQTNLLDRFSQTNIIARFQAKNPEIEPSITNAKRLAKILYANRDQSPLLAFNKLRITQKLFSKYPIEKLDETQIKIIVLEKLFALSLKLQKQVSELSLAEEPLEPNANSAVKRLLGNEGSVISVEDLHTHEKIKYLFLDPLFDGTFNHVTSALNLTYLRLEVFRSLIGADSQKQIKWRKENTLHLALQEQIPGLAKIHHTFFAPSLAFSLEKMDGDLTQLTDRLSENQLMEILLKIGKIIDDFHEKGYFHGDLKLENFLFKKVKKENSEIFYEIKACDLGFTTPLSEEYSINGTLEYLPPEAFYKKKNPEKRKIDSFSMGAIFFGLVKGSFLDHSLLVQAIATLHLKMQSGVFCGFVKKTYPKIDLKLPANEMFNAIIEEYFIPQLNEIFINMAIKIEEHLFGKIISSLLDIDPNRRMSVKQALADLEAIPL